MNAYFLLLLGLILKLYFLRGGENGLYIFPFFPQSKVLNK